MKATTYFLYSEEGEEAFEALKELKGSLSVMRTRAVLTTEGKAPPRKLIKRKTRSPSYEDVQAYLEAAKTRLSELDEMHYERGNWTLKEQRQARDSWVTADAAVKEVESQIAELRRCYNEERNKLERTRREAVELKRNASEYLVLTHGQVAIEIDGQKYSPSVHHKDRELVYFLPMTRRGR